MPGRVPAVRDRAQRDAAARIPGHHVPARDPLRCRASSGSTGSGSRRGRGLVAGIAVALATIPATAYELYNARRPSRPNPEEPDVHLPRREAARSTTSRTIRCRAECSRAASSARSSRRGPAGTCSSATACGREPGCYVRTDVARSLFGGKLEARRGARRSCATAGARFVLADCSSTADLATDPRAAMIIGVRRFGCAAVYELDSPGPATGPLAESRADAAVRATRRQ